MARAVRKYGPVTGWTVGFTAILDGDALRHGWVRIYHRRRWDFEQPDPPEYGSRKDFRDGRLNGL